MFDPAEPHGPLEHRARESNGTRSPWETNEPGFQALYQEYLPLIYRYILSHVFQREEAEDLTAQVFLKAVRCMDPERGPDSLRTWLYQVARTTMVDYWRDYWRLRTISLDALLDEGWDDPVAQEASAGDRTISRSNGERVARLLAALPVHYRDVLTCRFLLQFSIRETAIRLGRTESTIKVWQFRALKRAAAVDHERYSSP